MLSVVLICISMHIPSVCIFHASQSSLGEGFAVTQPPPVVSSSASARDLSRPAPSPLHALPCMQARAEGSSFASCASKSLACIEWEK